MDELWCDTHGMFHFPPGDPDCEFGDEWDDEDD